MRHRTRALLALSLVVGGLAGLVGAASPASAAPATAVTLTASDTSVTVGDVVELTATANGDLADDQYLDIYDATHGVLIASCVAPDTTCTAYASESSAGSITFIAYIDTETDPEAFPPSGIAATSSPVTVTWSEPTDADLPSSTFCPSPLSILDGTILGVYNKLVVQQDPGQTAVCVRVDGLGVEFGGALVISGGNIGVPTTDTDVAACQTEYVDQNVLSQRFLVAIGSGPGEVWVCLQAGSTQIRVRIPTGGLPSVAFYNDNGSTTQVPGPAPSSDFGFKCGSRAARGPAIDPVCVQYVLPI